LRVFDGAAGVFRVGLFEALESPFGDGVWDGAGKVECGEGVEALDVAAGSPDAGDPGAIAGEVVVVDLLDRLLAHLLTRGPDTAGRLEARDGPVEAGAGDPEARRHVAGPLVLYDARCPERAAGCDAEGPGGAAQLAVYGFVVA
jgi:hypothetical protein